jgi:hypothetical protein
LNVFLQPKLLFETSYYYWKLHHLDVRFRILFWVFRIPNPDCTGLDRYIYESFEERFSWFQHYLHTIYLEIIGQINLFFILIILVFRSQISHCWHKGTNEIEILLYDLIFTFWQKGTREIYYLFSLWTYHVEVIPETRREP